VVERSNDGAGLVVAFLTGLVRLCCELQVKCTASEIWLRWWWLNCWLGDYCFADLQARGAAIVGLSSGVVMMILELQVMALNGGLKIEVVEQL
jgi:hypothetical protein